VGRFAVVAIVVGVLAVVLLIRIAVTAALVVRSVIVGTKVVVEAIISILQIAGVLDNGRFYLEWVWKNRMRLLNTLTFKTFCILITSCLNDHRLSLKYQFSMSNLIN